MMKRLGLFILLIFSLSVALVVSIDAQTEAALWAYVVELEPTAVSPGLYDLTVPLEVMDKSRPDLADVRILDATGKEVPYAIRIRRELDETTNVGGNLFNHTILSSRAREVSVDLGEATGEHNEIEIETSGANFRRRVVIEGSDSGRDWKMLQSDAVIFEFESQNRNVTSNRVSYPTSRFRFLRVRVLADELTDDEPPVITAVKAVRVIRSSGELMTWNVNVPSYQLLRHEGAPASAWNIDLGAYVPCDRLILHINEQTFSRPFHLEAVDDQQNARLIGQGELTRRVGEEIKPVVVMFDQEEHVRKLRLITTDHRNQTLVISEIKAGAPTRQLVFELKEPPALPLRIFYGNPKAEAPHYDFEKEVVAKLSTAPVRLQVGPATANPNYRPEPLPLTERIPWLIYIVLTLSSLALGVILWKLAQSRINSGPHATQEESGAGVS